MKLKKETHTHDTNAHVHKKGKLVLAATGGMLALSMLLTVPTAALSPCYARQTDAFCGSKYCINLQYLNLTGDGATDIVMVAMSQLGYHEGDSGAQTNGANASGCGNYAECNYYNGSVDQYGNGTQTYGYPWCASFVSYCAGLAGISPSVLTPSVNCAYWVNWFRSQGNYQTRASGYVPKKGDLIFFRDAGSPKISTHVGIVRYVFGNTVYTVEGNLNQQVSLAAYDLNDTYIIGYGTPEYVQSPSTAFSFFLHAYNEGNYIIAARQLPVYSAPGGGVQTATLHLGDLMHIYESRGLWGRTDYGWIHMPDTQPVDVK